MIWILFITLLFLLSIMFLAGLCRGASDAEREMERLQGERDENFGGRQ